MTLSGDVPRKAGYPVDIGIIGPVIRTLPIIRFATGPRVSPGKNGTPGVPLRLGIFPSPFGDYCSGIVEK
jgi:hypothetical protein